MKTQEILAEKLGFVSEEAFEFATKRINEVGFLIKEENETNPFLLDTLSTYIDKFERERWNKNEITWENLEQLKSGLAVDRGTEDASFWTA